MSRQIARGLQVEQTSVKQVASTAPVFQSYIPQTDETTDGSKLFQISDEGFAALSTITTGRQICFASPAENAVARVSAMTEQAVLNGGVSQSGFALSSSVAATLVEAISYGTEFALFANCGRSFATATLRRVP